MKVKDLMTKKVITLSPDISAKEAAQILFDKHISGLPVVDNENRVIGMFTEKDLIRLTLPNYIDQAGEFAYLLDDTEGFEKKAGELENIKVKDVMRKEVLCVDEDMPMAEVARLIITKKVRRIPVLRDGKLAGIIAREDIVKQIMKKCCKVGK